MIYESVRAVIATTEVEALVDDIAPTLLDRGASIPAITFEVPRTDAAEEVRGDAEGWMHTVEISCHAYTVDKAEEVALEVVAAIDKSNLMLVNSIDRTWSDSFDENVVIRTHTINALYRKGMS